MVEKYFKRMSDGEIVDGAKEGVFMMIYCKDSKPHKDNPEASNPNEEIVEVAMLMNWRGGFGFPGGTIDDNEIKKYGIKGARLPAVIREVEEEIGFLVDESKLSDIICTHYLEEDNFNVHLFAYEVNQSELENIQNNFRNASHSRSETIGFNLIPCALIGRKKNLGLPVFMQHYLNFAVREELIIGLRELNLVSEEDLIFASELSGYDYKKLLGQ